VVVRRGVRPMLTHGSGARGVAARYGHATTKLISARVAYYHVNVMLYSTLHMSGHVNVYFLLQWRLSIQNKPFTRELWRHALPALLYMPCARRTMPREESMPTAW